MQRGILFDKNFRPQFSGHETFPLRYGWLKKTFDAVSELELKGQKHKAKDIFLSEDSIARFWGWQKHGKLNAPLGNCLQCNL